MINVWIDEMTPCLKDAKTGENHFFLNTIEAMDGMLTGVFCWILVKYMGL